MERENNLPLFSRGGMYLYILVKIKGETCGFKLDPLLEEQISLSLKLHCAKSPNTPHRIQPKCTK